ncbi:uncharacterized protein METZ01_LOCUS210263 [marine metagenome]|uniref:Uncharacterized protein n=1 Tax=marine metagenome TaxID=408172 RepID=A0A382F401_9ZZZZ
MPTVSVQDVITAATYNGLQSRVETVLGVGSTDTGYGQVLSSNVVSANSVITAEKMVNLKTDIDKCRAHQSGSLTNIATVEITDRIGADDVVLSGGGTNSLKGYNDFISIVDSVESDKLLCDDTQASVEAATSSTRTQDWNGTVIHTFQVTFFTDNARRHFFNTGGEVRFQGQLSNGAGSKDADWAGLLSGIGIVSFAIHATTSSGNGTPSAIGNFELTSTHQTVFQKSGSAYNYDENLFRITAKEVDSRIIEFDIRFQDDSGGTPDENVTGTLTSTITQRRASGIYVSVPSPTYSNTVEL